MNAYCLPEVDFDDLPGELRAVIYPSQKGVAYLVTYPKRPKGWTGPSYETCKVGEILLPVSYHAQQCQDEVARAFPRANAFRIYDETGQVYFSGSL